MCGVYHCEHQKERHLVTSVLGPCIGISRLFDVTCILFACNASVMRVHTEASSICFHSHSDSVILHLY